MILVDTDVLIDCLRGTEPAEKWLEQSAVEALGIPGIVAMELLVGCRNRAELQRVQQFLNRFPVAWPEAIEFAKAHELLATHRLTSALSIPDCVIAAMSLHRKARLYSFNAKHFQVVPG